MASVQVGNHSDCIRSRVHSLNWRESIGTQLQLRKTREQDPFEEICLFANNLFDKVDIYKSENIHLTLQREQLQQQLLGIQQTLLAGGSDAAKTIISKLSNVGLNDDGSSSPTNTISTKNLNIQHASILAEKAQLEKKILDLQDKLNAALKSENETVQKIIDLKNVADEKDRTNRHLTIVLDQREKEIKELKETLEKLDNEYRTIKDEHLALTLSYKSLEKRHLELKKECDSMGMQILAAKREDAERLNAENERIMKLQRERAMRELESNVAGMDRELLARQAAGDPSALALAAMATDNFESIGDDEDLRLLNLPSRIPEVIEMSFDAHEGGSTAVKWYSCAGPSDSYIATGGQDRKVKIWKIADSATAPVGDALQGSNSSITSIDVEGDALLASSNDYATRVWSLSSHRLNLTLTGHAAKVNSAKFLGAPNKIASGSADRTIKLWDVNRGACIKTFFACSTCYDLVYGNYVIISGHFDKKIRCWDLNRSDDKDATWMVPLGDHKVIAVDISNDNNKVVCCMRDNTIKCVDLRTLEVLQTYSDEKFKTGEEYWRVCFSNDDRYISCGSSDGSFFIWDVNTAKVEKVLKGHSNKVIATNWSPDGKRMVSIEHGRKVSIWA
uniref:Autophagy-related protein 16-1 n=1 Tax=Aceria tosichella TaxID=561515 RepID=A0A6G1SBI1_9ACAR